MTGRLHGQGKLLTTVQSFSTISFARCSRAKSTLRPYKIQARSWTSGRHLAPGRWFVFNFHGYGVNGPFICANQRLAQEFGKSTVLRGETAD